MKDAFDRHLDSPKVRAGLRAFVAARAPREHVDDLVQEVLLAAWKKKDEAPGEIEAYPAWLRGFARFVVPRFMKRRRREPLLPPEVGEALEQEVPEELLRAQALRSAELDTEGQRLAAEHVEQVLVNGQSLAEVARARGESPQAVSKRVWRSVEALRAAVIVTGLTVLMLFIAPQALRGLHGRGGAMPPLTALPASDFVDPRAAASTPQAPAQPPVDPGALLDAASAECKAGRWQACLDRVDDATRADPGLLTDARVKALQRQALRGLSGKPGR